MVENIKSICYLLNKDYNLFTQGNKWLYFFHYIFQINHQKMQTIILVGPFFYQVLKLNIRYQNFMQIGKV
jgi:hypothetical protein